MDPLTPQLRQKYLQILGDNGSGSENVQVPPLASPPPPPPVAQPEPVQQPQAAPEIPNQPEPTAQVANAEINDPNPLMIRASAPQLDVPQLPTDQTNAAPTASTTGLAPDDLNFYRERAKLLVKVDKGEAIDPLAPNPPRDPRREFLESKVTSFPDPFKIHVYGPLDEARPTVPVEQLDPASQQVTQGLYANNPAILSSLSDTDEEYTKKSRLGLSNWIRDSARIATRAENWLPFFTRWGAGVLKGGTFNIADNEKDTKEQVDHLGEEWLKESALPEFTGEVTGALAFGGNVAEAGKAALAMGGKTISTFGSYMFGSKAAVAAMGAAANPGSPITRLAGAAVKGALEEGTLGAAIGLGRKPEPGETRIDNAVHDALVFAGLGTLMETGFEAGAIRKEGRIDKAVTRLADDLQITKVEAEGLLQKRNPSAKLKDLAPELIDRVPREDLSSLSLNKGITNLAQEKGISLLDAAHEVLQKNPEAPIDLKLLRQAEDTEVATAPYKSWVANNLIDDVNGQRTFMPSFKLLEKAGQWVYDNEGLAVAPGLKIKTVFGAGIPDMRRYLIGESSAAKDAYLANKDAIMATKRRWQTDLSELIKTTEGSVPQIAESLGVSESAARARLGQVLEGSQTQNEALKYLGDKWLKFHGNLENDLRELGVLGDTRFVSRSRAEVKQLIDQKEGLIQKVTSSIESPAGKKVVQDQLREMEFSDPEEVHNLLKKVGATDVNSNDVELLLDKSRFLRSNYRDAGRQHLGVYYETHEQGRKAALGYYLKAESGPTDLARFRERQDLPQEVRDSLGEIHDTIYRAGRTVQDQIESVARGKFQEAIAKNRMIARPATSKLVNGELRLNTEAEGLVKADGWQHIPNDPKWGELADHVVSPYVYQDLKSTGFLPNGMDPGAKAWFDGYKKTLQAWKYGKVVLNPATHFRNMMSNTVLLDMSGMSFREQGLLLPRAAKELWSGGQIFKEAQEQGLFGNEFISQEVNQLLSKHLNQSITHMEGLEKAFGEAATPGFFARSAERAKQFGTNAAAKLGQIYQSEDQIFKLAKFMQMRGMGYSPPLAKQEAEKWLFNYADLPQSIRNAKDFYSPFISFTAKAAPRFFETVIERPWKLAKYGIYFNAIGNLGTALHEIDQGQSKYGFINTLSDFIPDAMKRETYAHSQNRTEKVLPDWAQTNLTTVGWPTGWLPKSVENFAKRNNQTIPRLVRMPFKDKYGREMWMDLTYILPFGDLGEKAGQGVIDIPRALFPQHPAFDVAQAVITNRDPYFGTKIAINDEDPLKYQKYMRFIGKTVLPSLFPTPSAYSWDKLMAAIEKRQDNQGRLRSLPIAAMDVALGIKMRPFNPKEEQVLRINEKERQMDETISYIRDLGVRAARNQIDKEDFRNQVKIYTKTVKDIGKEMGVLSNFGE